MKKQAIQWQNIFGIHITDKKLFDIKQNTPANQWRKKRDNPIESGQKSWIDPFRKVYLVSKKDKELLNLSELGNANKNHDRIFLYFFLSNLNSLWGLGEHLISSTEPFKWNYLWEWFIFPSALLRYYIVWLFYTSARMARMKKTDHTNS